MNDEFAQSSTSQIVRRWTIIAVGCTIAALLFSSVMYVLLNVLENVRPEPHLLFLWWAVRFYLWAALSPAIVYLLNRMPLQPASALKTLGHLGASVVFAAVQLALHLSLAFVLLGKATLPGGSSSVFAQAIHNYPLGVVAYWVIVAIVSVTSYYERYHQEQLRSSRLQAQLAEAQLQALQMQLQPHFVFNALHSLSDLVMEEPKTAVRLIARLGDFLRLTLQHSSTQWVPLKRELEFLDAYLEIERVRFADRLKVVFELAPDSLDAKVPNLILQPLVENAIRHGVASHVGPGLVKVSSKRIGDKLLIEVQDNGPGVPNGSKEGVGLRNTHERLQQTYGDQYSLRISNNESQGVLVSCELPYTRFQGNDDEKNREV